MLVGPPGRGEGLGEGLGMVRFGVCEDSFRRVPYLEGKADSVSLPQITVPVEEPAVTGSDWLSIITKGCINAETSIGNLSDVGETEKWAGGNSLLRIPFRLEPRPQILDCLLPIAKACRG